MNDKVVKEPREMEPMIQGEQVAGTKEKTHSGRETRCLESGVRQLGLNFYFPVYCL